MSLRATYQAFLASPSPSALADDASLHYITTLTTVNAAPAILKHLAVQEKLLKLNEQKVLSAVESPDGGLCVDVQVTIEFIQGGGAYLPGLDDNFVSDRLVTFPMVHIVSFDAGKITQIRKYWDQGSLLKQIEVIGARARNWPIRDGKDQLRLIAMSAASTPQSDSAELPRGRGHDEADRQRQPRKMTNNAMNDPHASLALFENRKPEEEGEFESHPIASRAQSAKPPPRNMGELFVGEESGSPTPYNAPRIPKKSGGGNNFKPNRLFDEDDEPAPTPMGIKTSSKKYDHFEFGDGENEDTPKGREVERNVNTKHQSQWDFEDFVTPEKMKPKVNKNQRSVEWSDDEGQNSPVHREVVHKPRRDADTHFEFKDDGNRDANQERPIQVKERQQKNKGGLYSDHIMGGDLGNDFDTPKGAPRGGTKGPLNDTNIIKNDIRKKDFGAHWEMKDDSPSGNKVPESHLTQNQEKVLKTMDANWGNYEPSPQQQKIRIAGNGMGGRSTNKQWSLFEEDPQAKKENAGIKSMGNGMGGRRGATSLFEEEDPDLAKRENLGKKSMSNGTGGRKGATSSFSWDF